MSALTDRGAGCTHGDHVCWLYSDDEERAGVLTAFLLEGVRAGDKLICYPRRGTEHRVVDYLSAHCDVAALLARGQLTLAAAEDVYLPDGIFDPDARIRSSEAAFHQAMAEGYPGLRVYGELGWLAGQLGDVGCLLEYELRADLRIARLPYVALCGYDTREWGSPRPELIDAVHRRAVGDGGRPSPFHVHGTPDGAVAMSGEIDYASADIVGRLLVGSGKELSLPVIDLSELSFIDGAGATAIFNTIRSSPDIDLRDPPPIVAKVWRLLGYDEVVAWGQRNRA